MQKTRYSSDPAQATRLQERPKARLRGKCKTSLGASLLCAKLGQDQDALDWLIEECSRCGDPAELDADKLCRRLMRLNFVAIHTTSSTMTNALLRLFGAPNAAEYVKGLREECERVLACHGGEWTKAAVNDLVLADSTIKESMRISSLSAVGLARMVRVAVSRMPRLGSMTDLGLGYEEGRHRCRRRHPYTGRRHRGSAKCRHTSRLAILRQSGRLRRFSIFHDCQRQWRQHTSIWAKGPRGRDDQRPLSCVWPWEARVSWQVFRRAGDEADVGTCRDDV